MSNTGIILSFTLITGLALVIALNHCEDDSEINLTSFEIQIPLADKISPISNPVIIELLSPTEESGHPLLNTIDWELRQSPDFSISAITTTANSSASEVKIRYTCGELEHNTALIPSNGTIKDVITWGCDSEMTAVLHALKGDTLVEYSYIIDIAFLNNLGLN
jgi:hypothetical protein